MILNILASICAVALYCGFAEWVEDGQNWVGILFLTVIILGVWT